MEFEAMRTLLDELRLSLWGLFEQGLALGGLQEKTLRELAARMSGTGLDSGAGELEKLCGELARSRLDTNWTCSEAAGQFARLWRYVAACTKRLEFLEAQAQL